MEVVNLHWFLGSIENQFTSILLMFLPVGEYLKQGSKE